MKKITTQKGKRFSRIEITSYPDNISKWERLNNLFKEHGRPDGNGNLVIGESFNEKIQRMTDECASFLLEQSLLYAPVVYFNSETDAWQNETLPTNQPYRSCQLKHYIVKELGYGHDSPEGLAADFITCAYLMSQMTGESQLRQAYKMGELAQLAKVYLIESNTNRGNAKKKRRKQWAVQLAEELVKNSPNAKFNDLWEMIPEDEGRRYDGFEVYRDDRELHAVKHKKNPESLAYTTFRTDYISPAKKQK